MPDIGETKPLLHTSLSKRPLARTPAARQVFPFIQRLPAHTASPSCKYRQLFLKHASRSTPNVPGNFYQCTVTLSARRMQRYRTICMRNEQAAQEIHVHEQIWHAPCDHHETGMADVVGDFL